MGFPANPTNGMIVEVSVGSYYKYDSRQGTWVKLEGFDNTINLASQTKDGLMSNDDYRKLESLLIPPPRTSLTSKNCTTLFDKGMFGFQSSFKHLFIEYDKAIVTTDESGKKTTTYKPWKIHENTHGIDFILNTELLTQILTNNGNLTYNKLIGPPGKQGPQGKPGINNLLTGPVGLPGVNGKNAQYPGFLIGNPNNVEISDTSRAVVNIEIDEDNFLVITRAPIGNLTSCPNKVRPNNLNTKWIVVLDETTSQTTTVVDDCCLNNCTGLSGGKVNIIKSFCTTQLYHLDISPIEQQIKTRFTSILFSLKTAKEATVTSWLQTMINIFNEQKLAICCALQNCQSKQQNQNTRNLLTTQQIQAAQIGTGVGLTLSCDVANTNNIPTNPLTCSTDSGSTPVIQNAKKSLSEKINLETTDLSNGNLIVCDSNFSLDVSIICNQEVGMNNAQSVSLDPGLYQITITDLNCFDADMVDINGEYVLIDEYKYLEALNTTSDETSKVILKELLPYTGKISYIYQNNGPVLERTSISADIVNNSGGFETLQEAKAAYVGQTFRFRHSGGIVKFFFDDYDLDSNGNITRMDGKEESAIKNSGSINFNLKCLTESQFQDCNTSLLSVDLNCSVNYNLNTSLVSVLPSGTYIIETSQCCCTSSNGSTGRIALQYVSSKGASVLETPDFGSFNDLNDAKNNYVGNTFTFEHLGGNISIWSLMNGTGTITAEVFDYSCYGQPSDSGIQIVQPDLFTCDMSLDQVNFYEAGWRDGSCCGFLIDFHGAQWIVVYRSVGVDVSCGGGESLLSDCVSKGNLYLKSQPAVAFQTLDGLNFLGKPTGGFQRVFYDEDLSSKMLLCLNDDITQGQVDGSGNSILKVVGSPVNNIKKIVFPFDQ